jgi:uncharacterized RmlC-like cupin family protein
MSRPRPVVLHPNEGTLGPAAPGLERRTLYDRDGRWAGWTGWIRNEAGDVSGWHHHAENDTYVYVIRGSVTIDFGAGGGESFVAHAGDFFLIPSQTIHREMTSHDAHLEAFIVRVGSEPEQIDVNGPDAGGSG